MREGEPGARKAEVFIIRDRCKGCGLCIEFCPKGVLEQGAEMNSRGFFPPVVARPEDCVGCGICQDICPDLAIFVVREGRHKGKKG
ncbi:hypothetical protein DRO32_04705, partial [Candidatus Bathyarchaeota archaeon]